ncbi:MAG: tetratricopeptide repeat protein [Aureispira sp.]
MDSASLKSFLEEVEEEGVAYLHNKGYQWFKSYYLPRLHLADELLPDELELIAESWYLVGDVYDFNVIPLLAIAAYRKVLEYDEDVDGAYRELALMYESIGEYQKALEFVNKALEYTPDDEELMDTLADINDSINYNTEAYLTDEDRYWKWGELLGQERPQEVIDAAIESDEDIYTNELRRMAQAYGMLEDDKGYIDTWERIVESGEDEISLDYSDWFYMPKTVSKSPEFWEMLESILPVIQELDTTVDIEDEDNMSVEELFKAVKEYYLAQEE